MSPLAPIRRSAALLAALVALPVTTAVAQGRLVLPPADQRDARWEARDDRQDRDRQLFRWTGPVDREVQLVLRGGDLDARWMGDNERRGADRGRVAGRLPRRDGWVTVQVEEGRGRVDVLQQPSERNDWTTIVRVRDERAGAGAYRLAAYWRPTGNVADRGGRDGRWDDDRDGRDDGDRWDRGDRNDRNGRGDRRGRRVEDRNDRNDRNDRGGWDRGGWGRDDGASSGTVRWRGWVDDVVELRVQGRRVDDVTLRGQPTRDVRADVSGRGLPARPVDVRLVRAEGRGRVTIVEQPSARNGYTAVLRIADPRGGAGWYDLDASW